jgi:peptidoglycan/LPS O-acetylase OafA/YrhL
MSAPVRFRSLDAWRGLCALCVAALHFNTTGFIHGAARVGGAVRLVDFFFVLSGFVIAHAFRDRLAQGEVASFLLRRVGRLWPLHMAMLAIILVMAAAGGLIGLHVNGWIYSALPANVTLTHAWGFLDRLTWNGPSWSISTEALAYLCYAIMAWRVWGPALDAAAAAVMLIAMAIVVAIAPDRMGSTYDFGAARCLYGFMAGTLANSLWRATAFRPRGEIVAVAATLAAMIFLPKAADIAIVPIFAWAVLVFASDAGPISRRLAGPLPQMFGRISYSIYMTHYVIGVALMTAVLVATNLIREVAGVATIVSSWWIADGLTLFYLANVVLVSRLTYAAIEKPGRRLFHLRGEPVPAAW